LPGRFRGLAARGAVGVASGAGPAFRPGAVAADGRGAVSFLIASQILLWILVLGLILVVFALARQIGVLHERIAPVGALTPRGGPEIGEPSPRIMAALLDGGHMAMGDPLAPGGMRLLLFVSSDCPVCKRLIPLAKSVAKAEHLDLILVGDEQPAELRAMIARFDLEAFPFINGPELGMAYQVGKLPYAVLLDDTGVIAAKGLVNTREHLESLVVAKTTGFGSIQSYLSARASKSKAETV
jgi:methylamine dehydrogenase accessory protein MauD